MESKKAFLTGTAGTVATNFILLIAVSPPHFIRGTFSERSKSRANRPSLMQIVALNVEGAAANWVVNIMMTSAIIGPGFTFMVGEGLLIFLDIWWAIFILSSLLLAALTVYFYKVNIKSENLCPFYKV